MPSRLRPYGFSVMFVKFEILVYQIVTVPAKSNHPDQDGRAADGKKQAGEPAHPTAPRHGLLKGPSLTGPPAGFL
jgi:hypothetical protein